jgi:two-component system, NarL family, invasion response regulator UvrY
MIRVAIADAHGILRWALREALGRVPEFLVVGEAATADELVHLLERTKPDVLVLDPMLPDHGTTDILAQVRAMETAPLVVMLAMDTTPTAVARAMASGAHAWVDKSAMPEKLLDAIHGVMRGEHIMPPGVEDLLSGGLGHRALTAREQQVMEMLGRGMTNREIAEHLQLRVKTIDTHRSHILKKLELRNNSDLTRFAVKHGYVGL